MKYNPASMVAASVGMLLMLAGVALWITSYRQGIFGGVQIGNNTPGFSVYNGNLAVWPNYGSEETHLKFKKLEFAESGTSQIDGGNPIRRFGSVGLIRDAKYSRGGFRFPLWWISFFGLILVVSGGWPKASAIGQS